MKHTGNGMVAALYCATFCMPSFPKSLKFFRTSVTSFGPETVELPALSILSAMFRGVYCAKCRWQVVAKNMIYLHFIAHPMNHETISQFFLNKVLLGDVN